MKRPAFIILIFILVFISCKQDKTTRISFTNTLNLPRQNEVVHLQYKDLIPLIGEFEDGRLPIFIDGDDTLVCQFIHYTNEGVPEEVLVEISLDALEKKELDIRWIEKSKYPIFYPKTGIQFARHGNPGEDIKNETRIQTIKTEESSKVFQMEGPAWENNKVGFRNYFDLRNGMDIFGKLTDEIVLQYVGLRDGTITEGGFNFDVSYHNLSDWGMDILKVGNSLGAGAVALEINDSLFRIGDNGHGTYEKLYEGPLKSEFRFNFPDWYAAGNVKNIIQYISITSGYYSYESSLFLKESDGSEHFVTGIVNKHSKELIQFDAGNDHMVFLTFDRQAEDSSMLAMAISIKKEDLISSGETKNSGDGITETYFIKLKTAADHSSVYRFYAYWERSDPSFGNLEFIKNHIKEDILKIENPIEAESR